MFCFLSIFCPNTFPLSKTHRLSCAAHGTCLHCALCILVSISQRSQNCQRTYCVSAPPFCCGCKSNDCLSLGERGVREHLVFKRQTICPPAVVVKICWIFHLLAGTITMRGGALPNRTTVIFWLRLLLNHHSVRHRAGGRFVWAWGAELDVFNPMVPTHP